MSEAAMMADAMDRLVDEHLDAAAIRAGRHTWLAPAWHAIEQLGLPLALLPEAAGGFGIAAEDALALVRQAGAAPLPIGETMMANAALAAAGLPLADGPAALVPATRLCADLRREGDRLIGTAPRVAWGRDVRTLVVEHDDHLARLSQGWTVAAPSSNLAGHPRDDLAIDATAAFAPRNGPPLIARGGTVRALQIAGALAQALAMTVDYVNERSQFGRPLAKFQAIQHEAARAAGEVASAQAAASLAVQGLASTPDQAMVAVAAARVRGGEAVGIATGIAHQLHGAIGFTQEHRLHLLTTACWAWRDEFGAQPWWCRLLGRAAMADGAAGLWPFLTAA